MNIKLAAFIIFIFSILAIFKTFQMFRRDKLTTRLLFMWLFIWFCIGFLALFPSMLDKLMKLLNMGDRLFFLTTGAIIFIYIIIFYLSSSISKIDKKISRLAQEVALLNYHLEKEIGKNKNKE